MRILHVNKFLYRRGGAEGYMEDVAALQAAHGHTVGFWGMAHPDNTHLELADTFAPHIELDPPPPGLGPRLAGAARMVWSRAAEQGLARALERFQPDVAHLHNIYHQLSPSILRALTAAGVPVVLTLHDYKLVCPNYQMLAGGQICEACLGKRFWNAPLRRCKDGSLGASALLALELSVHTALGAYDPVGLFICPSRFLHDKMCAGGIDARRLRVVRHFVDTSTLPSKARPGGDVLVAGRLSAEKGVDVAIEAAGKLPASTILHVAGDGPARAQLEALAAERAPGRVRFHGRLAKAELLDLLRSSAVALVPSRWYENQPMAVLEALACGVPVVASDLGGIPELIRPGVDGALVPHDDPGALADEINGLLADPERAFEMGSEGRRRIVEEFSPQRHLAAVEDVYMEVGRDENRDDRSAGSSRDLRRDRTARRGARRASR